MTTTANPTLGAPRPRVSRVKIGLAGLAACGALAGAIALAGGDETATPSAAPAAERVTAPARSQPVEPRPDIDQRAAAERFHHR